MVSNKIKVIKLKNLFAMNVVPYTSSLSRRLNCLMDSEKNGTRMAKAISVVVISGGNRTLSLFYPYVICGFSPLEFRNEIFWSQPVQ